MTLPLTTTSTVGTTSIHSVAVCCGCRPKTGKAAKTSKAVKPRRSRRIFKLKLRKSHYEDAREYNEEDLDRNKEDTFKDGDENIDEEEESFYFFDAEEFLLGEDVYPIILEDDIATKKTRKQRKKLPAVSEKEDMTTKPIANMQYDQYEPSERFYNIVRRPTSDTQQLLTNPRVTLDGQGYPGTLTAAQLDECQKFLDGLQELHPSVAEQIYSFRDVEEPALTICRWLRATKWDAKAILKRCAENQPIFDQAKVHHFYPDPSQSIGAPFSVFLSQYPFLPIGHGKNGCPVNYFQAGKINPEGILCLTTTNQLEGFYWWSFLYKMKTELRKEQARNPDFVRCEGINIIDLQGLSRAALSSDTMAVIKLAGKISDFFPETLHCMLILNAPGFFSMAWGLIKKFVDPQTARRIRVCSSKEQGLETLQSMINVDQIPKDYGGNSLSIQEAFCDEANDPLLLRQEVELLHVKRKSKASLKQEWEIQKGEYVDLNCYTRSSSGAAISIRLNGEPYKTVKQVECDVDSSGQPKAVCNNLVTKLEGTGASSTISVELRDLDNAEKKHSGQSRGYFLIVGDIKRSEVA